LNNCAAYNNQGDYGIYAAVGATLNNCTAYSNAVSYGIYTEAGSTLTNCSARANTDSSDASGGIFAEGKCTLTACTVSENASTSGIATSSTGLGISAGDGSTIYSIAQGNKARRHPRRKQLRRHRRNFDWQRRWNWRRLWHQGTGSDNRIQRNSTTHNDKGISVAGTGNLIDGNHVRDNSGFGIEVTTATGKNVIVRNEAGNNGGSYSGIAAGNQMAPTGDPTTSTNPFLNILN
jgi:parallel beta-helix repeat protein